MHHYLPMGALRFTRRLSSLDKTLYECRLSLASIFSTISVFFYSKIGMIFPSLNIPNKPVSWKDFLEACCLLRCESLSRCFAAPPGGSGENGVPGLPLAVTFASAKARPVSSADTALLLGLSHRARRPGAQHRSCRGLRRKSQCAPGKSKDFSRHSDSRGGARAGKPQSPSRTKEPQC